MNRRRLAAIVLVVVGASLFALGTSIEKDRHHDEPSVNAEAQGDSHDEAGESAEQREAEGADEHSEANESEGKILGIDRESAGLVVLAVVALLALAALLWQRPSRGLWLAVGLMALAFAIFDVAEVIHQFDESDSGLAVLAALVALAHVGAAAVAPTAVRPDLSA